MSSLMKKRCIPKKSIKGEMDAAQTPRVQSTSVSIFSSTIYYSCGFSKLFNLCINGNTYPGNMDRYREQHQSYSNWTANAWISLLFLFEIRCVKAKKMIMS
jgi:hypothetical protein